MSSPSKGHSIRAILFSDTAFLVDFCKKKLPLRYWYAALQTGDVLQNAEACTEYLPGDFRQKFSFQSVAHRKYSDVAREW